MMIRSHYRQVWFFDKLKFQRLLIRIDLTVQTLTNRERIIGIGCLNIVCLLIYQILKRLFIVTQGKLCIYMIL